MLQKSRILFSFVVTLVVCSEFELFHDDLYPQTINSFWKNSSLNPKVEKAEAIYLSVPLRLIDFQLRFIKNSKLRYERLKLVPRFVPKQVGGYPGVPVVCYYCNVFWGTAGHYPSLEDSKSCVDKDAFCGEERPCCSPYKCEEIEVQPDTFEHHCTTMMRSCKEDGDCETGQGCVNKICKNCIGLGESCPGKSPCCHGSCLGGTCEHRQCIRHGNSCGRGKSPCCTGLECKSGRYDNTETCHCRDAGAGCNHNVDCCKGNACVGNNDNSHNRGVCTPKDCTSATVRKICGKYQWCVNNKCVNTCIKKGQTCGKIGDNRPCCDESTCVNGVCKHTCIKIGSTCHMAGDHRPCCAGDGCIHGKCEPEGCRLNGSKCNSYKDCCWKKSVSDCKNGRCEGCLEIGEDVAVDPNGCRRNQDCCRNGECTVGIEGVTKGRCYNNGKTCDVYGKNCLFDKNNCCKGLVCKSVSATASAFYCSDRIDPNG